MKLLWMKLFTLLLKVEQLRQRPDTAALAVAA